jgi:hypothetical protein
VKNEIFLPRACETRGGGTLIENSATLKHNKWYLLCFNVAVIRRSIARGDEYPLARIGKLVMNRIGVEGGAKTINLKIGEARIWERSLTRSPPEFSKFLN